MKAVSYTLLVDGKPADSDLLAAIQQIEVEDHADIADILRLRIAIGVGEGCSEWSVVDQDLFPRLGKIKLLVTVGSGPAETLIDARVIATDARFANQPGQSVLNVVAIDPTVLMNLEEKVKPWPDMSDSDIATEIFSDREYGFTPVVQATSWRRQQSEQTVIQRTTDIRFLRHLARRNGFECYVETHPQSGKTEGHFHPPRLDQKAQGVLSVNLGETTNVNSFQTRYDMLRPTRALAAGLDSGKQSGQKATADTSSLAALGGEPTLDGDRPRWVLLAATGLVETGELQTYAQAVADRSAWAIRAEGELNTAAYGGILRAKRPLLVRGAGRQFSGRYYVERVHHTFTGDGYSQRFTLRRNALAATRKDVFTDDQALAALGTTGG